MKKSYKDYIFKLREYLEIFVTASSIVSITVILLNIIKLITLSSSLLPLPLILAGLYLATKFIPMGVTAIKKQLLRRNVESMTEDEIKELEDMKTIIDDKCSSIKSRTPRTTLTEPISTYTDNRGNIFVKKC
jgi:hypothetical protein